LTVLSIVKCSIVMDTGSEWVNEQPRRLTMIMSSENEAKTDTLQFHNFTLFNIFQNPKLYSIKV